MRAKLQFVTPKSTKEAAGQKSADFLPEGCIAAAILAVAEAEFDEKAAKADEQPYSRE
jgi:hypothetical protein